MFSFSFRFRFSFIRGEFVRGVGFFR